MHSDTLVNRLVWLIISTWKELAAACQMELLTLIRGPRMASPGNGLYLSLKEQKRKKKKENTSIYVDNLSHFHKFLYSTLSKCLYKTQSEWKSSWFTFSTFIFVWNQKMCVWHMCVYLGCLCVCTCVYMEAKTRDQYWVSSSSFIHHITFLRQGLSLNLLLNSPARLPDHWAAVIFLTLHSSARIIETYHHAWLSTCVLEILDR